MILKTNDRSVPCRIHPLGHLLVLNIHYLWLLALAIYLTWWSKWICVINLTRKCAFWLNQMHVLC